MRILVTGGAGYIGSVVVDVLLESGHQVVVLDDLSTGHPEAIPRDVTLHEMPLSHVSRVLTPQAGFDAVIHLAAKALAGESVQNPALYWDTNVVGTLAVLEAMRQAGVSRLVFSSTGSMYRPTASGQLTEEAEIQPVNPYAHSKYVADTAISYYAQAFGLGATSLRYFNAAGAYKHLGERHDNETHLIPTALKNALENHGTVVINGDDYDTPDGTCIRDYVHVADLAAAHLLALAAIKPARHTIYNLGNGDGFSNRKIIDAIAVITGACLSVKVGPRRSGDAAVNIASSEKAQRELGWKPRFPDLTDIITSAWKFHKNDRCE